MCGRNTTSSLLFLGDLSFPGLRNGEIELGCESRGMKPKRFLGWLHLQLVILLSASVLLHSSDSPSSICHQRSCLCAQEVTNIWARALLRDAPKPRRFLLSQLCAVLCLPGPRRDLEPQTNFPGSSSLHVRPHLSLVGLKASPGEWGRVAHHCPKSPIFLLHVYQLTFTNNSCK